MQYQVKVKYVFTDNITGQQVVATETVSVDAANRIEAIEFCEDKIYKLEAMNYKIGACIALSVTQIPGEK